MMYKQIWKYQLETADWNTIKMPIGSEILTVQTQGENICLWALVNPNEDEEERIIEVVGTGFPIECDLKFTRKYINSYQLMNGRLVFHVFERLLA